MANTHSTEQNIDIDSLEARLTKLEGVAKKPNPKDFWDKLTTISSIFSGVLIAGLGIYATTVYNTRKLEANAIQRERELAALELQTVEAFFEHLSSETPGRRKSALETITSTGNWQLAIKLAVNFGGKDSKTFLENLSASNNSEMRRAAEQALKESKQKIMKNLDIELAHRLSLLNDLIQDSEINDRVMSAVQDVFEENPPSNQSRYTIGGPRFLLNEYAAKNLSSLLKELQDVLPDNRRNQAKAAIEAATDFKAMMISTQTRQVYLSGGPGRGGTVGDIPDFSAEQIKIIKNEIIPGFKYWLDYDKALK